jgi:two-component system phosphate regulon sensor histidine kinase PhoR
MAAGDLDVRTHAGGRDELAELGRTLDRLAESLQTTLAHLRDERDLLSAVLDEMQEGVLLLGPAGTIELVNPALREMLLLDAGAPGRPLLEVVRHADLKELVDRAFKDGAPVSGEIEIQGLRPRHLLVRASPLARRPGGLLAVLVDLTDLRRLESLRRDFVANVSHELRTPIAAVRAAAETLRTGAMAEGDAAGRFIGIVERNAERLQQLVNDLLDLARIESRQYRIQPERMTLDGLVAQVLDAFRAPAGARRIVLSARIAPGTEVVADRRAIEQVLSNLVDNAVKYAREGTEVVVRAGPDGAGVTIAVEDGGPGIEARHLPRLFERFYRVDAGRSRERGGTGLGLSIVKNLCEAMAGSVSVESEMERGTTFRIRLPAA